MFKNKYLFSVVTAFSMFILSCSGGSPDEPSLPDPEPDPTPDVPAERTDKVVVAYVTSWSSCDVNPDFMTHVNYAFGHVTDDFSGVRIDNESRLRTITDKKRMYPKLNVLLSVGGWGSGRFSEMAADETYRKKFAADCKRVCDEFNLDGIDIDWEFPTTDAGGEISCSPDDTRNYTLMMRDIREAIGGDKFLTLATSVGAGYIDFRDILPYIDFVNIMAYDMNNAPHHNASLYRSDISGWITADEGVRKHLDAGVPASKLVLGMPFYGHGRSPYGQTVDFKDIRVLDGCTEKWDNVAMVPYMANSKGELVLGFDNARSLRIKCEYAVDNGLHGVMYWDYDGDNIQSTLRRAVATAILNYPDFTNK